MITTTERIGKRAWQLLDLDLQGRVYRFTDAPTQQTVTDRTGATFTYTPGLSPVRLERHADATGESMSVVVDAPQSEPWALLEARGHSLDNAPATLRRWYEGQVLDVAEVWIRGRTADVTWGNAQEPIAFSISRQRRAAGVIPSADMRISADTWPVNGGFTVDDSALGAWYPMVFGRMTQATTPAYMVEFDAASPATCKLLIAGHEVSASSVTLHDVKGEQSVTRTVQTMADGLGRTVSYVDFSGAGFAPETDREYRIAWDQGGGGMKSNASLIEGAGEVMLYLLRTWTDLHIDAGRFEAARSVLDAYLLAFCIVEQVSVWDWVDGEILSLLPVEWTDGASGEYPATWRLTATTDDLRGHIDCTRVTGRYTRVGGITSSGEVRNRLTLQYSVGGQQQRPTKAVTVGSGLNAQGEFDVSDGTLSHPFCTISERVYGRREAPVVVTEIIDDADTASRIVRMWATLYALPRRALQVEGDLTLDGYQVHDVVSVTATDVHITSELASVRGKMIDGDTVTVDLLMLDNPLTRSRATT